MSRSDGVMICGQCRDPLIKKPLVNSRQIFGFFVASAFLTPLLLMIAFVIKDFNKEKHPGNAESIVHLSYP
tara:strand:+ start:754 stop:966 length:213 start_codon:yes stop_codon:yes gene_type:complete